MVLQVELVSPERVVFSGEAQMVVARTVGGGDIAFMDGHTPVLGALDIALATIRTAEGDQQVALHGGFVEVAHEPLGVADAAATREEQAPRSSTRVTILSDVAELSTDIDVERARPAKERAEKQLEREHDAEAEGALRRAHARLLASGHPV